MVISRHTALRIFLLFLLIPSLCFGAGANIPPGTASGHIPVWDGNKYIPTTVIPEGDTGQLIFLNSGELAAASGAVWDEGQNIFRVGSRTLTALPDLGKVGVNSTSISGVFSVGVSGGEANAVPIMSSNTTPYGTCFQEPGTNTAVWRMFDSPDALTGWTGTSASLPVIVGYEFPYSITIEKYTIVAYASLGNTPNSWDFVVWNETFSDWDILDTHDGVTFGYGETKTYPITTPQPGKKYGLKIRVSEFGTPNVVIRTLKLIVSDGTTEKLTVSTTGALGSNQTAPAAQVHVTGTGATSATKSFLAENSSGTDTMYAQDDGVVYAKKLGVNVAAPAKTTEIVDSAAAQIRLTHTAGSSYCDMRTDSNGYYLISPSGGTTKIGAVSGGNYTQLATQNITFIGKPASDERQMGKLSATWFDDTDASRKGQYAIYVNDFNAERLALSTYANGTGTDTRIGDPAGGNYVKVEADGTVVFYGASTVFEDVNVAGESLGAVANAPDSISWNTSAIKVRAFDGNSTAEELHGALEIPHSYKEGSDIVLHNHWSPTTTDAGDVEWCADYVILGATGSVSSVSPACEATAAGGTAWAKRNTDIAVIGGENIHMGDQMIFRIFRTPSGTNDTYEHDAALLTVGIHYERDAMGSRSITTK